MPSPSTRVISIDRAPRRSPASRNSLVERAASTSSSENTRSSGSGCGQPLQAAERAMVPAGSPVRSSISAAL